MCYVYTTIQKFGFSKISDVFERSLLPRLLLFDQHYSTNRNIVKYYWNLSCSRIFSSYNSWKLSANYNTFIHSFHKTDCQSCIIYHLRHMLFLERPCVRFPLSLLLSGVDFHTHSYISTCFLLCSGGVMIYFDCIEVVNYLVPSAGKFTVLSFIM